MILGFSGLVLPLQAQTPFLDDVFTIKQISDVTYGERRVFKNKGIMLKVSDLESARDDYAKTDPETVETTSMDLYLDIYHPDDSEASQKLPEKLPAIVFAHGGGWVKGNKSRGKSFCNEFAQRGYVAVSIQYKLD